MAVVYNGENFIEAFDSGYQFNKGDLNEIVFNYSIETDYGDNSRGFCPAYTIVNFNDRYFGISWHNGLTETQPNEFYAQRPKYA